MPSKNLEIFEIIDIVRLKRNSREIKTFNKSCSCLSCRLDGESLFFYNNDELTVKKGDILYIPKNCSYSQKTTGEEAVCFHLATYRNNLRQLTVLTSNNSDEVCTLFDESELLWRQKKDNYYYSCLSNLYKILSLSNLDFSSPVENKAISIQASKLAEVHEHLSENLFNPELLVDDLYKLSHMGRTDFNTAFKNIYGATPRKYIYQERINKAKLLLSAGNYTNEEIASLCGFTDVKYFYIVFKKVTGMSTKQYKNS